MTENLPEKQHQAPYGVFVKDPDVVVEFCELIGEGYTVKSACRKLGLTRQVVERAITKGRKQTYPGYTGKISELVANFYELYQDAREKAGKLPKKGSKLNRAVIDSLSEMIINGSTLEYAATSLNIHVGTIQGWIRRAKLADPDDSPLYGELLVKYEAAMAIQRQMLVDSMHDLALNAKSEHVRFESASWMLERQHGYTRTEKRENLNTRVDIEISTVPTNTGYKIEELDWSPNELEAGEDTNEDD